MFSVFIYSIFLPLQLGMIWSSIGLPIYLFIINRMIKHFNKEKIVAEKTLEKLQMFEKNYLLEGIPEQGQILNF